MRPDKLTRAVIICIFLLATTLPVFMPVAAEAVSRNVTLTVAYTQYNWWLISWVTNEIQCQFQTDHEGLPTASDIGKSCSQEVFNLWQSTPPCVKAARGNQNTTSCAGLYLHLVSSQPATQQVQVNLPSPTVWVNLEGCSPTPPENRCTSIPNLLLTGEEPLPNEKITAISGVIDGQPFECNGAACSIPLRATNLQGTLVEFWAKSSYGDTSEHFTAQVRIIDTGVPVTPGSGGWYIDIISTQWRGAPIETCARIWQSFPPVGGPPAWLSTPENSALLATGEPYYYLAGRLIARGVVDASSCPTGGLLPNGYADACGLEAARSRVEEWQNQFDKQIVEVARSTGVPAQLMKNLFAQESQFWPGIFRVPGEIGLGQITDNGADSLLLWNNSFYEQFCPLVLNETACAKGYLRLSADEKAMLRGAVTLQARTDCTDCPVGIDLTNAHFSINLFAQTLQANCSQVGQIIHTATQQPAGKVSTYEDLWRFTVANYHAGPGCLSYAIFQSWQTTKVLNWEQVAKRFTDPCKGVVPYINKITR